MNSTLFNAGPRKFWTVTALVLASVLVALAASILSLRYIQSRWRVWADTEKEIAGFEEGHKENLALAAALRRLRSEEELIRSSFINPDLPLPFIESIEDLGRRTGIKVELALAPGSAGARGEEYTLAASGAFRRVMSFFQNLELFPYLIQIRDAEMRVSGEAAEPEKPKTSEPAIRLLMTIRAVIP